MVFCYSSSSQLILIHFDFSPPPVHCYPLFSRLPFSSVFPNHILHSPYFCLKPAYICLIAPKHQWLRIIDISCPCDSFIAIYCQYEYLDRFLMDIEWNQFCASNLKNKELQIHRDDYNKQRNKNSRVYTNHSFGYFYCIFISSQLPWSLNKRHPKQK